jgi:hypothetical protein
MGKAFAREGQMIKFIYQFDDDTPKISMKLEAHANLEEVCEAFENFLRGSGYVFDGTVAILNEPENKDN